MRLKTLECYKSRNRASISSLNPGCPQGVGGACGHAVGRFQDQVVVRIEMRATSRYWMMSPSWLRYLTAIREGLDEVLSLYIGLGVLCELEFFFKVNKYSSVFFLRYEILKIEWLKTDFE